jgi:hypothetical protein
MNNIVWVPVGEFAKEYNKSKWTIIRWIHNRFIFSLGVSVKRDISGRWYVGTRPEPPSQSSHTV